MLRSALRRIVIVVAVIVGLTTVLSLGIGALDHANLLRALAIGFYLAGSAVLIGSFVLGMRGPWRSEWGEEQNADPNASLKRASLLPKVIRRTTPDERVDARKISIALFVLGLALILIGAGFDPSRNAF